MKLEDLVEGKEYKINKPKDTNCPPLVWIDPMEEQTFIYQEVQASPEGNVYQKGFYYSPSWMTEVLPTEVVKEEEEVTTESDNKAILCIKDCYWDEEVNLPPFAVKGKSYPVTSVDSEGEIHFLNQGGDKHIWSTGDPEFHEHFILRNVEEDTLDTKGNGICTTCGEPTNSGFNASACDVCHGLLPITHTEESVKSDGGSSDYYKLKMRLSDDQVTKVEGQPLVDVTMETGDVIRSLVDNDFDLGNIIKAIRRIHQAKKGQGKAGTTVEYDCKKIEYFLKEWYTAYQKEQI